MFLSKIMLVGAEDALYGVATRNGGKKKPIEIPGIGNVYQMAHIDALGIIIAITGTYFEMFICFLLSGIYLPAAILSQLSFEKCRVNK